MSDLLRKDGKFQFGPDEQKAFSASKDGIAVVFLQRSPSDVALHPTHYLSHKTSPIECKYSSYDLAVLVIVYALQKLRVYLLGLPFKIVTDCKAFQQIMQKKEVSTKIWTWAEFLEDFEYRIEHRHGTRMKLVDALSRHTIMTIEADDITARVKRAQQADPQIQAIISSLNDKPDDRYVMRFGVLYRFINGDDLLVTPCCMEDEIIRSAHQRGHFATKKTEEIIKRDYYIASLTEKVNKIISNCVSCLVSNRKEGRKEGYLNTIEKTDLPLHTYHVDHLGPLESTSKQYNHIFAVIDAFSKFVWLYPTRSTTAREVIERLER